MAVDQTTKRAATENLPKTAIHPNFETQMHRTLAFGKHSGMTYEQTRDMYPQYCTWVKLTADMEEECDPRLSHFAVWLHQQDNQGAAQSAAPRATPPAPTARPPAPTAGTDSDSNKTVFHFNLETSDAEWSDLNVGPVRASQSGSRASNELWNAGPLSRSQP